MSFIIPSERQDPSFYEEVDEVDEDDRHDAFYIDPFLHHFELPAEYVDDEFQRNIEPRIDAREQRRKNQIPPTREDVLYCVSRIEEYASRSLRNFDYVFGSYHEQGKTNTQNDLLQPSRQFCYNKARLTVIAAMNDFQEKIPQIKSWFALEEYLSGCASEIRDAAADYQFSVREIGALDKELQLIRKSQNRQIPPFPPLLTSVLEKKGHLSAKDFADELRGHVTKVRPKLDAFMKPRKPYLRSQSLIEDISTAWEFWTYIHKHLIFAVPQKTASQKQSAIKKTASTQKTEKS